jgi:hypothetical protein
MALLALSFLCSGLASWFMPYQRVYDGGHHCAMNHVRPGTRVRVVAGRYDQRCAIIGSGPFVSGRVIDLSPLIRDDLHMQDAES